MNVSRRAITIVVAATAAVAVFAGGFVVGRTTGEDLSAEARACRVFDLASSRLKAAAVSPTKRGYFSPELVNTWQQQTELVDAAVATEGLDDPVFSALRDVSNAYASTTATTSRFMDSDSWNTFRIDNVLAANAEAEVAAQSACDELAS